MLICNFKIHSTIKMSIIMLKMFCIKNHLMCVNLRISTFSKIFNLSLFLTGFYIKWSNLIGIWLLEFCKYLENWLNASCFKIVSYLGTPCWKDLFLRTYVTCVLTEQKAFSPSELKFNFKYEIFFQFVFSNFFRFITQAYGLMGY